MLRNYIKITFRNLWKTKGYASINILGLAVGLTSFLVLLLYLNHELSFDRWDPDLDKVYKVSLRGDEDILNTTPAPLAALLRDKVSQVESATSMSTSSTFEMPISAGEKQIFQSKIISADSLFFNVFPYKIVQGEKRAPLSKPNAVVISEHIASTLFGQDNPIGKVLRIYNSYECEVTAVMETPDGPTHLDVEMVHRSPYEKNNFHWSNWSYHTYVKTTAPMPRDEIETIIAEIYHDDRLQEEKGMSYAAFQEAGHKEGIFMDAVHDIYNFPKHGTSNISTVSILLLLATLLLFAGAINFSNLSIASSLRRAKEVGVKKVLGSSSSRLFWQFMGEITIQCLMALVLSFILLSVVLPIFNQEFNIDLRFFGTSVTASLLLQITICLLFVILLSGLYPAVFLSRYNTAKVLKGDYSSGKRGVSLRNSLIVVQFVVAAFFIMGVFVVNAQLDYLQKMDKGFSGDQVLRIQAFMQKNRDDNFGAVRQQLLQIPGVQSVSKSTKIPGDLFADTSTMNFKYKGAEYRIGSIKVSTDYFQTLGIELVNGRLFGEDRHADQHTRSVVINETAARKIGLQQAGGEYMSYSGCDSIPMEIIGVVQDFNVTGFEHEIQPAAFTIGNEACVFQSGGGILVKMAGQNIGGSVAAIEEVWRTIEPGFGLKMAFMDDNYHHLYTRHIRLQRVVTFFGMTAITIAVMGLFALTAFLIGQRTKEISIRKVLGAGIADLGMLLSKDFVRLIALAVLIAVPIGWWASHEWLKGFAYRITLTGWVFALAGLAVLLVAAVTVGIHTLRASRANIADKLREE